MAIEQLVDASETQTTRRKIVTTGARLAYAAPIVAATISLGAKGAEAVSANGACTTFVCGSGQLCVITGGPFNCACFETVADPGVGRCTSDFFCGETPSCNSDADCPGGGTCVTNTCCGLGVQLCAPPCPGAQVTGEGIPQGHGLTATGKMVP